MNHVARRVCITLVFALACACYAEKPYWWDNPHKDDDSYMYERGTATDCPDEQSAIRAAMLGAKDILIERVGVSSLTEKASLRPSSEYALVNCEEVSAETERNGKHWSAWVLLRYPQKEKEKLLVRWQASVSSIAPLVDFESQIPIQFALTLKTGSGNTQYREGDLISFTVSSDKDAYLVLLDYQSDGTTVVLFPNEFHPNSRIHKGEVVCIPDPANPDFALKVGAPFGDDRIEAIASTEFTSLQGKTKVLLDDPGRTGTVATTTRGIMITNVKGALGASDSRVLWSRAELTISTYE